MSTHERAVRISFRDTVCVCERERERQTDRQTDKQKFYGADDEQKLRSDGSGIGTKRENMGTALSTPLASSLEPSAGVSYGERERRRTSSLVRTILARPHRRSSTLSEMVGFRST